MIDAEELLEQYRAGEISGRTVKQTLKITHGQFQKLLAERGIAYRGKPEPKFDMEHFHALAEKVERGELKKSEASAALGITAAYFGQMMQKHGYRWRKMKKRPPCEFKGGGVGTGNPCAICGEYFCEWMQQGKPVPGWDAKKIERNNNGQMVDSYAIKSCPKFKAMPTAKDRRRERIKQRRAW